MNDPIENVIACYLQTLIDHNYKLNLIDVPKLRLIDQRYPSFTTSETPTISINDYLCSLFSPKLFNKCNISEVEDKNTKNEVALTMLLYLNFFLVQTEYNLTADNIFPLLCVSFYHAYNIVIEIGLLFKEYVVVSKFELPSLRNIYWQYLAIIWAPSRIDFNFILTQENIKKILLLFTKIQEPHNIIIENILWLHQDLLNILSKEELISPENIAAQKNITTLFNEVSSISPQDNNTYQLKKHIQLWKKLNIWLAKNSCLFKKYYQQQHQKTKQSLIYLEINNQESNIPSPQNIPNPLSCNNQKLPPLSNAPYNITQILLN